MISEKRYLILFYLKNIWNIIIVYLYSWFYIAEKDEKCITNILKQVDKGDRECQCGVDCDETGYETKISSSVWPSPKYEVSVKNIYWMGITHSFLSLSIYESLLFFNFFRKTLGPHSYAMKWMHPKRFWQVRLVQRRILSKSEYISNLLTPNWFMRSQNIRLVTVLSMN